MVEHFIFFTEVKQLMLNSLTGMALSMLLTNKRSFQLGTVPISMRSPRKILSCRYMYVIMLSIETKETS